MHRVKFVQSARAPAFRRRDAQGGNRPYDFAVDPESLPARGDHPHPIAPPEEGLDRCGRTIDDVFTVVHNQERLGVSQQRDDSVG